MKLLLLVVLQIASFSAFGANLTGIWSGSGTWETSSEGKIPCQTRMLVAQTQTLLRISQCHSYVLNGANFKNCTDQRIEINGKELFYEGYKVGELTQDGLKIDASLGTNSIKAVATIKKSKKLDYFYEARDLSGFVRSSAMGLNLSH